MAKINGGYYIKARCIQNSEIAIMPPYIREIWDWLLKEANHTDSKSNGSNIKRGQLVRTFRDIQEGLKWMIGYRKMTYKKWQCENAMKFLRKRGMVTTMKTTRGMLVTICNYSLYQDPKNYESNTKADTRATVNKQLTDTINNNGNKDNNANNVKKRYNDVVFLTDIEYKKLVDKFGEAIAKDKIEGLSLYLQKIGVKQAQKYKSHYATILCWDRKNKQQPSSKKAMTEEEILKIIGGKDE